MSEIQPTDRTRVRQVPQRACYDRATINAILDEGLICHVGFVHDDQPYVLPMNYARAGDRLLLHGARGGRLMQALVDAVPLCATVTLVDGLVVARSVTHLTMNYRSVVIVGQAIEITDHEEKRAALRALVEHALPGRSDEGLPATDAEVRATTIVAIPVTEASAKLRSGPPTNDSGADEQAMWSGEIPLRLAAFPAVAAPECAVPDELPPSVANWQRAGLVRVSPSGGGGAVRE